jgi:hypothetical protein
LSQRASHEESANNLYNTNGCKAAGQGSPQCNAVEHEFNESDSWQNWAIASGVVAGVGVAAIVASFFLGDDPKPKDESSTTLLPFITTGERSVGVGVVGSF